MEILTLLQTDIDALLMIFGIIMFLVFIYSANRMMCLVALLMFSFSVHRSEALTLKIEKVSNADYGLVSISGFTTGRVYQVDGCDSLVSPNWTTTEIFFPTSSVIQVSKAPPTGVEFFWQEAGWYLVGIDPNGTNYVWQDAGIVYKKMSEVGFYHAHDITDAIAAYADRKKNLICSIVGLNLFFVFRMVV